MDETPITDADCEHRAFACELAQWLFGGSSVHPASVGEFIAAAAAIAHFITDGEGVAIQCGDDLIRFVRGE